MSTSIQEITSLLTDNPAFGKLHTDNIYVAQYSDGNWQEGRMMPYQNISLSPFALCFHYGQTIFEGMKAFRMADGNASVFRPEKNFERMAKSAQRMCMPAPTKEIFMDGLDQLIKSEQNWIPAKEGYSLYLRPFMIATESRLGVKVSDEYLFFIVASPVGPYYADPVKVKVELEYVRASTGGTGAAKCGGNYGAAFYPTELAKNEGFHQVLWTDSKEHKYIEECGTMNVMFIVEDKLVTPPLSGSILAGVTRESLLKLAADKGMATEERPITVSELEERMDNKSLTEAFGAGTAAVVAPIRAISIKGRMYELEVNDQCKMYEFKRMLSQLRTGKVEDKNGWNHIIKLN